MRRRTSVEDEVSREKVKKKKLKEELISVREIQGVEDEDGLAKHTRKTRAQQSDRGQHATFSEEYGKDKN